MKFLLYISYSYGFPIVRPLQAEILKRGFEAKWFVELEESKKKLLPDEILLNTVEDVLEYKPDAVLVASNEVPHFFPGIKVQLFHGFSVNKRSKDKGHFRIRGLFDLYCTQGPSTTKRFKKLAKEHGHFKVVETGWSKVDVLFPSEKKKGNKPVIFLASTFTERLSLAYNEEVYKKIVELIEGENWEWIINLHPKMDSVIVEKFQKLGSYNNVTYIPYLDTLEPLKYADVMFTDTSSIITEFAIQNKPVITFRNNKPKRSFVNITEVDTIKLSIEHALNRPKKLMKRIKSFALKQHPYVDGKSSKRVVDAVLHFLKENESEKLKKKPLNLFRKLQLRKRFGYFRF
ncbi:UDP-N-acetylglucosamine 2-epimerase [Lutibacter sp. B1]|uniref:UDP-N-acetylglucosamine 2-epimerase n=1 Tax=Lutibacter sp. B1 TaxID=2725996 RepID=UPI00145696E4|nr:UDP-N-acetylglucosamine 2-epimerase [Lutibacter sp. B1]NLP56604.1 CDP-glycerol glycerophosphotransferase [Lutibacter sp. B1]